jgi:high-affinity iron transporter
MQALRLLSIVLFSLIATASIAQVAPPATQDKTKQIWQLLDYLAVDYGRSVKEGQIANEAEYAEMQEFAQAAERQLAELPAVLAAPTLASDAAALRALIAQKASAASVGNRHANWQADSSRLIRFRWPPASCPIYNGAPRSIKASVPRATVFPGMQTARSLPS